MGADDLESVATGEVDPAPPTAGDLFPTNGVNHRSAHMDDPSVPQRRQNGRVRDSPDTHPLRCVAGQPDVRFRRDESWL